MLLAGAAAQPPSPKPSTGPEAPKEGSAKAEAPRDRLVTTRHAITLSCNRRQHEYDATAGTLVLKDDEGKPRASIFFIAYTKVGETAPSQRPITFAFNGGPGSSSVWLHLGALGPRRAVLEE